MRQGSSGVDEGKGVSVSLPSESSDRIRKAWKRSANLIRALQTPGSPCRSSSADSGGGGGEHPMKAHVRMLSTTLAGNTQNESGFLNFDHHEEERFPTAPIGHAWLRLMRHQNEKEGSVSPTWTKLLKAIARTDQHYHRQHKRHHHYDRIVPYFSFTEDDLVAEDIINIKPVHGGIVSRVLMFSFPKTQKLVHDMKKYLENQQGFSHQDIKVLKNPTKDAMKEAFCELTRNSHPGDMVIFYSAGYDGQSEECTTAPSDNPGYNPNIIIPSDVDVAGALSASELCASLLYPMRTGVTIMCILDGPIMPRASLLRMKNVMEYVSYDKHINNDVAITALPTANNSNNNVTPPTSPGRGSMGTPREGSFGLGTPTKRATSAPNSPKIDLPAPPPNGTNGLVDNDEEEEPIPMPLELLSRATSVIVKLQQDHKVTRKLSSGMEDTPEDVQHRRQEHEQDRRAQRSNLMASYEKTQRHFGVRGKVTCLSAVCLENRDETNGLLTKSFLRAMNQLHASNNRDSIMKQRRGSVGGNNNNKNSDRSYTVDRLLLKLRTAMNDQKVNRLPQITSSRRFDMHGAVEWVAGVNGARRAVLVCMENGSNTSETVLAEAHRDVLNVSKFLQESWHFCGDACHVLIRDEGYESPTCENVLGALKELVRKSGPGDIAFVYLRGVWDKNSSDSFGPIQDRDICQILVDSLAEGAILNCLMDFPQTKCLLGLPYDVIADDEQMDGLISAKVHLVGSNMGGCTNPFLQCIRSCGPHRPWPSLINEMDKVIRKAAPSDVIPQVSSSRIISPNTPMMLMTPSSDFYGQSGTKRALLIGINYTDHINQALRLEHCHTNVRNMKHYLQFTHSVLPDQFTILLDDGRPDNDDQPTRSCIMDAFRNFSHSAAPGDAVFVYFSGHGGSILKALAEDQYDNEEDGGCGGGDETQLFQQDGLLPLDIDENGFKTITTDDIMNALIRPFPDGASVTLLFDCFESDSVLTLPYKYIREQDESMEPKPGRRRSSLLRLAQSNKSAKKMMQESKSAFDNIVSRFKGGWLSLADEKHTT